MSSPTMNRLEQQMARTNIRRLRVRSGTELPRSAGAAVVSIAQERAIRNSQGAAGAYRVSGIGYRVSGIGNVLSVNARMGREFRARRPEVHEVTARQEAGHVIDGARLG